MVYGYIRVSSIDQHLDRQIESLNKTDFKIDEIFTDKLSGKNFERNGYIKMRNKLKQDDIVVVKSIDRLGRNYDMIIEEWTYITKTIGADIVVLDMPLLDTRDKNRNLTGKFIADIVLQILSYVAQTERENTKQRQREGIDIALARGVKFGRPIKVTISEFVPYLEKVKMGVLSVKEAYSNLGISKQQWYNLCKEVAI